VDVYIGDAESEVRPVESQGMVGTEAQERLVAATVERLAARDAGVMRQQEDTKLWHSVRAGTGR
jgi:hypothetical protein